jgi:hypothetical protein
MRKFVPLFLCVLPSVAMARDTVWLENGDRIVGDIVFKDGDRIVIETDYAGRVDIDWDKVATLETEKPISVVVRGVPDSALSRLDVFQNGSVICKQCAKPVIALKDVDTLVYPAMWISDFRSEGHVDLSADFERKDNDIDEYNLDAEVRLYHGKWRHVLEGEKEKKSEDDVVSKDKWDVKYSIDRFLGERFYVRTGAEYQRDYEGSVVRARAYSVGPGYLLWDDRRRRLDVSLQYARYRFWFDSIDFEFDAAELAWDFRYVLFGGRVTWYMKGEAVAPDTGIVEAIIDSEVGMKYRISGWLSANVGYETEEIRTDYGDVRYYQTKVGLGASW